MTKIKINAKLREKLAGARLRYLSAMRFASEQGDEAGYAYFKGLADEIEARLKK